jgi:long-chain acyl-CoA synthetase
MSLNLAVMLVENARRMPQHPVILCGNRRVTYGELDRLANQFANVLGTLGLSQGQKVVLMLPNVPEFAVGYYGTLKAGGVVVPINVLYKSREIEYLLEDSEAVVFVVLDLFLAEALEAFRRVPGCRHLVVVSSPGTGGKVEGSGLHRYDELMQAAAADFDMVQTEGDDTAVIVYTSGTTGKPKGAELSHFSQLFQCRVLPDLTEGMSQPDDVTLVALPLFHAFGQTCLMGNAVGMGTTISLQSRFEPAAALQLMERHRVTVFAGVPTMYVQLLNCPERKKYDLSQLRRCVSGGAPIAIETLQTWKREYGFDIQEGYGLTETSPVATYSAGTIKPKYGSCGKPIWGCDVKIVNDRGEEQPTDREGEVLIRGVNLMKGYYKNPEETAIALKGGWLHTGDVGKMDAEGYLYIVGRIKDMIIRGGYNVYPREIEELLYEHPAVQECAVVGVPHVELGEEVKAVLYLKDGCAVTPEEIRQYCKDRMAAFKYPRLVDIRAEPLPKGPTGKILKRELTGV